VSRFRLPREVLTRTFEQFRKCGCGRRECQALWVGPWSDPLAITDVIHPKHSGHMGGFTIDEGWLHQFWLELGRTDRGIRLQVHTHPGEAFHSATDDAYPIIHKPGFLSLVIPNFALGPVGFKDAYLTEIQPDGRWRQADINERIDLT
jgi:hypothetical protein